MRIEAVMLLIPCIISLIYHERVGFAYLISAGLCMLCGFIFTIKKTESSTLYLKDGCIATASCWIVLSFFGALPLWISREIPSFVDALFESVSGFTTTGASILNAVEDMSYTGLFWRSLTHWIGGMGILVFLLAIIPLAGGSNLNLMRAESTGASVGKLVPKIRATSRILYLIYLALTVIEAIALLIAKMPLFDSICTAMATAGTGGFGIKNDSIAGYNPAIQWIVAIFMFAFGVNFYGYYFIVLGKIKKAFQLEEIQWYLGIIVVSILTVFIGIRNMYPAGEAIRQATFQVGTIISSTGFATADFDKWPEFIRMFLMMLTFIGSCAGSTGGGMKVSRIMILFKSVIRELNSYIHPRSVTHIKMDGKNLEHGVVRGVRNYFLTYMLLFCISILIVSAEGNDFVTNITSVTACMNNTGPGLSMVGPASNFGFFSNLSKIVLMFDMIAGRLELFPLIILFHPQAWKDLITRKTGERKKKLHA